MKNGEDCKIADFFKFLHFRQFFLQQVFSIYVKHSCPKCNITGENFTDLKKDDIEVTMFPTMIKEMNKEAVGKCKEN